MKKISIFFASSFGRVLRSTLGIILLYVAVLSTEGITRSIILVVAGILFLGAALDLCGLGAITHKNMRGSKIRPGNSKKGSKVTTIAIFLLGVIAIAVLIGIRAYDDEGAVSPKPASSTAASTVAPPENIDSSAVKQNAQNQEAMLQYLIEEEKLAHDVYTMMYQIYGAKVFGNILSSEENHQDQVLALLKARNINDPRSSELGVFKNVELQRLYDDLVAKGRQSESDAYRVGVAIEEKDIADITKQLATATDADTVSTLERLRSGSENHLRAFNRQLGSF